MDVRKNIYDLTDTELALLQQAIYQMKANGKYDDFVMRHHLAAQQKTLLFPGEVTDRNIAHGGPAFLPWHRVFIREFEQALQAEVPGVTLPYWDWAADSALGKSAPLWNADSSKWIYLGGRRR
jgi:tyrosinase